MFKSKSQDLIIPQYEHGRMAGILATQWGNNQFNKPVLNFSSFVEGVTFHDWHYGTIDNLPIGEATEMQWLKIAKKGADYYFEDPIADIISKLQLKRLLKFQQLPQSAALLARVEAMINERLSETKHTLETFVWADKITNFCDQVAFHFSFQHHKKVTLPICTDINNTQTIPVTYTTKITGIVEVDPWPFAVNTFSGLIIGYQAKNYPTELRPKAIPFRVNSSLDKPEQENKEPKEQG